MLLTILFSESYTGADLLNDPAVSFPNRAPQLVGGSSISFSAGVQSYEKLVVVPLLPSGTLSTATESTITVNANLPTR